MRLHRCTYVHTYAYGVCMCVCVCACACATTCVCVPVPACGASPSQQTQALTVDVNHNERPQGDAGHGGQLPSHQSHNLVNLAVAQFKVVLQSAFLDGLCDCSGPVHGADSNDNLQTGRQTDRQTDRHCCGHYKVQQALNGRNQREQV